MALAAVVKQRARERWAACPVRTVSALGHLPTGTCLILTNLPHFSPEPAVTQLWHWAETCPLPGPVSPVIK